MYADRKVIHISSGDRDPGTTNENFTITKVVKEFPLTPKSVKLVSASIPYTWNNVRSDNNTFVITFGGIDTVVTIPDGNYTGPTLATALVPLVTAVLGGAPTVTFNTSTLKFTITSTTGPFTMSFPAPPSTDGTAYNILGFVSGGSYGPAISIVSINYAVLVEDMCICVCSDLVEGADNGIIPYGPTETPMYSAPPPYTQGILACIPVNLTYPCILNYTAPEDMPFFVVTQSKFAKSGNSAKSMRFFLRFLSGAPIDLKNYKWDITLIFDFNKNYLQ